MFRLKIDRKDYIRPEGPFLVVSNHSTFMDFLLVMLAFYPRRMNAVTAQKFFIYRPLNWLLPIMGCIPKNLFDPDIRAIKCIKTVLKRKGAILLFPEGRCSTDGVYAGIHKSTGKLVKNLGVPVMSCHVEGGYICMPFWRKGLRPGRVRLTLASLFTAEDTKTLSVDEINGAIDARLAGCDTCPPLKPFGTFRTRRLTEGLHTILYWCPDCGSEFTLETKGNTIRCGACGISAVMEAGARLLSLGDKSHRLRPGFPSSVHMWFREQVRYEMKNLSGDMDPIVERVAVRIPAPEAGGGMRHGGNGILRLTPQGWYYDGEISGESVSMFFPIDTVPAIPVDPEDDFQIYSNGSFFMFTPEDARKCIKYSILGECAYWRFATRCQMTPGWDSGFSTAETAQVEN